MPFKSSPKIPLSIWLRRSLNFKNKKVKKETDFVKTSLVNSIFYLFKIIDKKNLKFEC